VTRVLVTGAGGAAGVSVIRALLRAEHTPEHVPEHVVVAADPDPLAAGLALADEALLLPFADDERFVPAVVEAVERHGIEAVITTVAEEMPPLQVGRERLAERGAAFWSSPTGAVQQCIDKWRFARAVEQAKLPGPGTVLAESVRNGRTELPGPWVVKPRFGRGSRDVSFVDEPEELAWIIRRTPEAVIQTRCRGREFTADALLARDGSLAGVVPRWRLETKAGISTKGTTFSDPRVERLVRDTAAALDLEGAINLQGFVDADADPDDPQAVQLVEVNPRFSGGLALSLAAGADLVGEFLRGTLGLPIRPERCRHEDGVTMTRYHEEVFVRDGAFVGAGVRAHAGPPRAQVT
jgi:carbamoyl-phosphate synthase large subunit